MTFKYKNQQQQQAKQSLELTKRWKSFVFLPVGVERSPDTRGHQMESSEGHCLRRGLGPN